jgi:hypothetical protein
MEEKPIEYSVPDFTVPETKRDSMWYANAVRYYTNVYFNRPFYSFNNRTKNNNGVIDFAQTRENSPIDEIIRNWSYVLGEQEIGVNSALINSRSAKAIYRAGLEIGSLVNHKVGQLENVLQSATPTAEALSKEAKSTKQFLKELTLMQKNNADIFDSLMLAGVMVNPLPQHVEIAAMDEISKNEQYTFKEFGEVICERIASKFSVYNDITNKFLEATRQAIVGGIVGIDLYTVNGMLVADLVPAHQNIWDNNKTDSFLREKRIAGRVYYRLSAEEILARWGDQLSPTEKSEIRSSRTANMSGYLSAYNSPVNSYNLWAYPVNGENIEAYSAVKMYFKGPRDIRMQKNKKGFIIKMKDYDENGKPIKDFFEKKGDFEEETWYTATLIGNKYVVDFGRAENIAYESVSQRMPQCPLVQVVPNMILDQYKSDVSKIRQIQDEIDYYTNKIKDKAVRDWGKNYIIRGKSLGLQDITEFLEDFRAQSITLTTEDGEEANSDLQAGKDVQTVDLTLDPNIMRYVELKASLVREMREVMSLPDAAIGLQKTIIGKAVQENTMQASNTGLAPFYNTMLTFFQTVLQTAVNMQKLAFSAEDMDEVIEEIVGSDGLNFLKVCGNVTFDYYGIYISIADMIKPDERAKLIGEAMMAVQADPTLLPYMIKVRRFKTYTEAENYLDHVFAKREKEKSAEAEAVRQQQAALAAQSTAAVLGKAEIAKEGQVEAADMRKTATETAASIAADAKNRKTEADLIAQLRKPQQGV